MDFPRTPLTIERKCSTRITASRISHQNLFPPKRSYSFVANRKFRSWRGLQPATLGCDVTLSDSC